tara:strand:+ start:734 stop:1024 length:291 start_codon:yes stop_codon:yes gene_type:complete
MKSLLKDLAAIAVTPDLTANQLNSIHDLIEADLITLGNGVALLGGLMRLAFENNQAIGQDNLGNIGELLTLMGNQISALHLLDDLAQHILSQGGEI